MTHVCHAAPTMLWHTRLWRGDTNGYTIPQPLSLKVVHSVKRSLAVRVTEMTSTFLYAPPESSAPVPPEEKRRSLILALAAPAVLVCVAVLQLYLSHSYDLSAWKGGGFGMFASVDRVEHRAVRASID